MQHGGNGATQNVEIAANVPCRGRVPVHRLSRLRRQPATLSVRREPHATTDTDAPIRRTTRNTRRPRNSRLYQRHASTAAGSLRP